MDEIQKIDTITTTLQYEMFPLMLLPTCFKQDSNRDRNKNNKIKTTTNLFMKNIS